MDDALRRVKAPSCVGVGELAVVAVLCRGRSAPRRRSRSRVTCREPASTASSARTQRLDEAVPRGSSTARHVPWRGLLALVHDGSVVWARRATARSGNDARCDGRRRSPSGQRARDARAGRSASGCTPSADQPAAARFDHARHHARPSPSTAPGTPSGDRARPRSQPTAPSVTASHGAVDRRSPAPSSLHLDRSQLDDDERYEAAVREAMFREASSHPDDVHATRLTRRKARRLSRLPRRPDPHPDRDGEPLRYASAAAIALPTPLTQRGAALMRRLPLARTPALVVEVDGWAAHRTRSPFSATETNTNRAATRRLHGPRLHLARPQRWRSDRRRADPEGARTRASPRRCWAASGEASQKSSIFVASPWSSLREIAHISTGSSPRLRCDRGRARRDAHGRAGAHLVDVVAEAHRQRAAHDEVDLLDLRVEVPGPLLEVGVRRHADERHRELLGAQRGA